MRRKTKENNFKMAFLVLINMLKIVLNVSPQTLKMNHKNITVNWYLERWQTIHLRSSVIVFKYVGNEV